MWYVSQAVHHTQFSSVIELVLNPKNKGFRNEIRKPEHLWETPGEGGGPGKLSVCGISQLVYEPQPTDVQSGLRMLCLCFPETYFIIKKEKRQM